MSVQPFHLADEWTSPEDERALVAAVAKNPALYWELLDLLPAGAFADAEAAEAWEKGGAAALDSLKESGDLEYTADAVLFLTQAKESQATPPARAVDLTLAKNRNGDIGKVELIFRPDIGDFREVARR